MVGATAQTQPKTPLTEEQKYERKIIKSKAKLLYKNNPIIVSNFHKPIEVSTRAIKEWLNQPFFDTLAKNKALLRLPQLLENGELLKPIKDKHDENTRAHIFSVIISEKESWVIVREFPDGSCLLHSISDSPKIGELAKR